MLSKVTLAVMVSAAACGSARVISSSGEGGVIELQGDRAKAMDEANRRMAAQCGADNFSITREGKEPISPTATVWRVHFECGARPQ